MQDPARWIPTVRETVTVRRALVVDEAAVRLVEGLEVYHDGAREVVSDPSLIAALLLVDGRRSVRDIISAVLADAPPVAALARYLQLLAWFTDAYLRGIIGARMVA